MEKEELKFKPGDKICGKSTQGTDIAKFIKKEYTTIVEILEVDEGKIRFTVEGSHGYWECNLKDIYHYEDYQNIMDIEVGDTVRCISKNKSKFDSYAGDGWKPDLEFKVTKIVDYIEFKVYVGGKNTSGVYSDAVRLVKRKEPERTVPEGYKAIGKVKAPNSNVSCWITPNKEYIVFEKIGDPVYKFILDDKDDIVSITYKCCTRINGQDWIIVEENNKPELEWKVGAYVRYKGTKSIAGNWFDYFGALGVKEGDVGMIIDTWGDSFYIQDIKRGSFTSGSLLEEDLELITGKEYDAGVKKMREDLLFPSKQEEIIVKELEKCQSNTFPINLKVVEKPKLKFKSSIKEFKINKVNISNKQLKKKKNEQIKFIR